MAPQDLKALLTPAEAARYLGVSLSALEHWRSQRRGPAYIKLEGRLVRYRLADLEKYLTERSVECVSTLV
jgi:excisionase family DNA binding protein